MTGILRGVETERTELGRRVRRARLMRGWSKEQAAREARISAITWKRIEDGLSVQDAKRYAALRVLGITEDAAFDEAAAEIRAKEPALSKADVELAAQIAAADIDEVTRERLLRVLRDEEVS